LIERLTAFLDNLGLDLDVADVTAEHLREFLAWRTDCGDKARTLLTYYRTFHRFFSWLVTEGERPDNPLDRIAAPKPDIRVIRAYTDVELKALFREMNERDLAMFMMLLDSGLRAFELCRLILEDVDMERGIILVKGKGRKERRVRLGFTVLRRLDRYLRHRRQVGADSPLFQSQSGEPLTVSGLAQALKRAARRARMKGAHLHKFRHTFAVRFLELGGHPDDLRELLGHESYAMVRHYTRDRAQDRALKAHARFSPGDNFAQRRGVIDVG
jgi:site-specific recombinase XerD